MKNLQIHPFILIIFTLILTCNCSQHNPSKNMVTETNHILNDSEKLRNLFNAFLKKQTQIKLIRYKVRRIDTLVSGTIRNNTGVVTLQPDKNDLLVGFSFYGKRDDTSTEDFYVDNTLFKIALEHKFYSKKANYGKFVLGTPCGQMVVTDLIKIDTTSTESSLINIDDSTFVFKSVTNQGSSIGTRVLTIDKRTLIPNRITITKIHQQQKWKQSITFDLTNILINDQVTDNKLLNLYFKTGYARWENATARSTDDLIGKKVPEIVLHTFKNESINIRSLESQLVLLDFWELWCSPCVKSLPTIEEIANAYKSYGLITFGVVSDIEKATEYVKEKNFTLKQVKGNQELNSILKVNSYPRYVLIDRKGLIQSIYYGYSDNIELDINSLLLK